MQTAGTIHRVGNSHDIRHIRILPVELCSDYKFESNLCTRKLRRNYSEGSSRPSLRCQWQRVYSWEGILFSGCGRKAYNIWRWPTMHICQVMLWLVWSDKLTKSLVEQAYYYNTSRPYLWAWILCRIYVQFLNRLQHHRLCNRLSNS